MRTSIEIPSKFLSVADELHIPQTVASTLYLRLSQKKGWNDLVVVYAKTAKKTEKEVRATFCTLRDRYRTLVTADAFEIQEEMKIERTVGTNTFMDEAREAFNRMVGPMRDSKKKPELGSVVHTIYCSDLHIPYADKEAVGRVLSEDAHELVILGDILDMYSAARFRPTIDHIAVREELAMGRAFLEEASRRFDRVYLIKGNHDDRPVKRLQETLPQLVPLMIHPIDLLSEGLANVEVLSTTIQNTAPAMRPNENYQLEYMASLDDVLLGHFNNFMGKEGAVQVADWVDQWSHVLKLPAQPRMVLQAHVHRLTSQFTPKGQLLITTGCLARPMPYQFDGHGKYTPPTMGYVKAVRYNGRTDLNSVRLIHCS